MILWGGPNVESLGKRDIQMLSFSAILNCQGPAEHIYSLPSSNKLQLQGASKEFQHLQEQHMLHLSRREEASQNLNQGILLTQRLQN
nr:hypothetical protein Iba_chr10dCG15360 [Ipomoea batatas]